MGVVQLRQIKTFLEANFGPHVDLSDYSTKPEEEQANVRLTRSLAAFAVANAADVSPEVAGGSVTDGYDDNGIDAIYYAPEDKSLYLCQSKWSNDGSGSIDLGSTEKFIRGVTDILSLRFDRFNAKVGARKAALESAINDATRIHILAVYSGSESLGDHPKRVLNDLLASLPSYTPAAIGRRRRTPQDPHPGKALPAPSHI